MPFSNPIVGGGGSLVVPSIHSPNYQAGSAGWTINKDGTVEFNSATFRGNIFLPDNQFTVIKGIFFQGNVNEVIHPFLGAESNGSIAGLTLAGPDDGASKQSGIELWSDTSTPGSSVVILGGGALGSITTTARLCWGANPMMPGNQYYEEVHRAAALVLTSGASVTVAWDTLDRLDGYYSAAFNLTTGVWTCPEDGYYIFSVGCSMDALTAAASRIAVFTQDSVSSAQIGRKEDSGSIGLVHTACYSVGRFLAKGATISTKYFQNSGANRNYTTNPATGPNFCSVKRIL